MQHRPDWGHRSIPSVSTCIIVSAPTSPLTWSPTQFIMNGIMLMLTIKTNSWHWGPIGWLQLVAARRNMTSLLLCVYVLSRTACHKARDLKFLSNDVALLRHLAHPCFGSQGFMGNQTTFSPKFITKHFINMNLWYVGINSDCKWWFYSFF